VGAEFFHEDERTDGHDEANSHSCQLCERAEKLKTVARKGQVRNFTYRNKHFSYPVEKKSVTKVKIERGTESFNLVELNG
jgi:hypothetical protein